MQWWELNVPIEFNYPITLQNNIKVNKVHNAMTIEAQLPKITSKIKSISRWQTR